MSSRSSSSSHQRTCTACHTTTCCSPALLTTCCLMLILSAHAVHAAVPTFTISTLVSSESVQHASITSVATYVSPSTGATTLYISALGVNSTVSAFNPVTGVLTPIVRNTTYSNCLDAGSPTFGSDYPISPNAIAVGTLSGSSSTSVSLLIADRTPSTHIYAVNTTVVTSTSPSFAPGNASFDLLVGAPECTANVSVLVDGAASSARMKDATYLTVDSRTGVVYFTQRNSIFSLSRGATSVFYYLGDERAAGNRSSEPYTEVDRLAARTQDPSQIAIDEVGNMMYVAETGMGTVRQVDMATGAASVVIGKFLVDVFPPASCSASNPCTADNVTFAAVTSVALYRARSTNQRWLFIGDYTAAVVYRMILETGVVTIVAGSMLLFGTTDGSLSVSRLFAPRSLAVGESAIYIADGSLRRLELNDAPPAQPPVVSPVVVDTTSTSVVVATLVVGLVNPTGVTQASRANVLLNLAQCDRDFGELPIFTHLLQFPVGNDPDFQYFAGAVIGNIALCVATVAINALVVYIFATLENKPFGVTASSLKFPSLVSLPLLFVLNPTVSVGISLMSYASGWLVAIGAVGFVASLLAFGGITVYFVFIFEGHNDFEMLDKKFSGIIAQMVNPVGEWLQTDLTGRMGMFFEDYLPSCWWFVVVELGMCVMSGIIEGIRPAEQNNCLIAIGLAAALYTAYFAALVLWKPYTVRLVFYIRALIAGLQMLSAYLSLASVKTKDRDWEAAGTILALLSMYVGGIDAVFALLITIRDIWTYFNERKDASSSRLRRYGRDADGSNSDDADENFDEMLAVPLVNSSMTRAATNDSFMSGSPTTGMPPRTVSSSSEEEELLAAGGGVRKQKKPKANLHEIMRNELTGLMSQSNAAMPPADGSDLLRDSAPFHQYTHGYATGDYFIGNSAGTTSPLPPFGMNVRKSPMIQPLRTAQHQPQQPKGREDPSSTDSDRPGPPSNSSFSSPNQSFHYNNNNRSSSPASRRSIDL